MAFRSIKAAYRFQLLCCSLFDYSSRHSSSISFNGYYQLNSRTTARSPRSGGTQMKTSQRLLSAFPTVTIVNTVYTIKASLMKSSFHGLKLLYNIGVSQWRWPDGLAERLAPSLTFCSTFLSRKKWKEEENKPNKKG